MFRPDATSPVRFTLFIDLIIVNWTIMFIHFTTSIWVFFLVFFYHLVDVLNPIVNRKNVEIRLVIEILRFEIYKN